jgi:hypothetical protein
MPRRHHREHDEEPELIQHLRRVVREESGFKSLRKNGESWPAWVAKIVTPDRVLWFFMALFVLGGRAEKYTNDLSTALSTTSSLKSDIDELKTTIQSQEKLIRAQADMASEQERMHATKTDVSRLGSQVQLTITRQEWQSTMRTQILPRLERIERRLMEQ